MILSSTAEKKSSWLTTSLFQKARTCLELVELVDSAVDHARVAIGIASYGDVEFLAVVVGRAVNPQRAAVLPYLRSFVLEPVDRDHGQAHLDLGGLADLDAIALSLEDDAMVSDRTSVLQHSERVFAGIAGERRGHTGGREEPRHDEQQAVPADHRVSLG